MVKILKPIADWHTNKLIELLEPEDESEVAKSLFWEYLGKSKEPNIAWYPNSGWDFTDLLSCSPMASITKIGPVPDIFIHSDYNIDLERLSFCEGGDYFVNVKDKLPLTFKKDVCFNYRIDPNNVWFTQSASPTPRIDLLLIEVTRRDEKWVRPVIYFYFESINLFTEFILPYDISLSHIIKINDGAGAFASGKIGMTVIFPFFSKLNTRFLIADYISTDNYLLERVDRNIIDKLKAYSLEDIGTIWGTDGITVTAYKVLY